MDCLVEALPGAMAYVVVESELDAMMIYFAAKKAKLPMGVVGPGKREPETGFEHHPGAFVTFR